MDPRRLRLRTLSIVGTALLAVLVVAVVAAALVTTDRVYRAVTEAERSARGAVLIEELDRTLREYHRLGNLWVATREREVDEARAAVADDLVRLEGDLLAEASTGDTAAAIASAATGVDAYLAARRAAEARGRSLAAIVAELRPVLERALDRITAVRQIVERELRRAHQAAHDATELQSRVVVAASAFLLAGLIVLALAVRGLLLLPVLRLCRAMTRFRDGDLAARAPPGRSRESAELADAFNDLADAITRARSDQLAFLAGVAHDLRGPLSALKLGLQALGDGAPEPTAARLARLDRQTDKLERMATDLLDATRIEAGHLELRLQDLDLVAATRSIAELHAATAPAHTVTVVAPPGPVVVHADPLRIDQIVSNLVGNAIKYSPHGGPVALAITSDGRCGELAVTDRGIGIPAEDLATVFAPFRRRPASAAIAPGAGLGLSVVRRIVTAHHGTITVTSTPGEGSTFRVRLPLAAARRAAAP